MCIVNCLANATYSIGTVVTPLYGEWCLIYPWWAALLPIVGAMILLYVLINQAYGKKWGP